ncbi:hypothetical protein HOLleu_13994 [Holothuria leucospilota]|uniref:Uncharacterized protein n=1 Tax=Holothuria leucospilota TaxID=206669 RepID=A0A9Q1C3T8_HOLLE|nr:hypothetical protein HOLleu_18275 [Holothuria leucospilota]KAJ8039859.1 hypothetical protein HOLleu_13994 [Holothuria leucospilota]
MPPCIYSDWEKAVSYFEDLLPDIAGIRQFVNPDIKYLEVQWWSYINVPLSAATSGPPAIFSHCQASNSSPFMASHQWSTSDPPE